MPRLSEAERLAALEAQIASLQRDGVTQLSRADLKTMRPEQIVKARQEGRLLRILAGG